LGFVKTVFECLIILFQHAEVIRHASRITQRAGFSVKRIFASFLKSMPDKIAWLASFKVSWPHHAKSYHEQASDLSTVFCVPCFT
jgi:hypothetical protein